MFASFAFLVRFKEKKQSREIIYPRVNTHKRIHCTSKNKQRNQHTNMTKYMKLQIQHIASYTCTFMCVKSIQCMQITAKRKVEKENKMM